MIAALAAAVLIQNALPRYEIALSLNPAKSQLAVELTGPGLPCVDGRVRLYLNRRLAVTDAGVDGVKVPKRRTYCEAVDRIYAAIENLAAPPVVAPNRAVAWTKAWRLDGTLGALKTLGQRYAMKASQLYCAAAAAVQAWGRVRGAGCL